MSSNPTENARDLAAISLERMPKLIEKIRYRIKPIDVRACYSSLSHDHLRLAFADYFVDANIRSFKQHLHVASKLELVAIQLDSYQRFTMGQEILYALLSDNPALIDTLSKLEPPYYMEGRSNPLHSEFRTHMYQLAIQGEYEVLQAKVERLAKNGRKKERELPAQGKDFFSLLMHGDKQGLEDLIGQHARVKAQNPLFEDFMCFQGTLEAKLCWFKGIPVQIDSPLLPMGLMQVEPLAHYDDVYDFLQPGWEPPAQGLIAKVSGWFKK